MDQNGKKHDIFISYRRKGGLDTARYLYDHLKLDGYSVTFDLDSLRSGRFDEALLERIDECTDFVVVLNKGCFDRTLDLNFPRENDWLRMELGYAIGKKKNVIPVLLGGYEPPPSLPSDIREVLLMNGPEHSQEYIDAFYGKLKAFLRTPSPTGRRNQWLLVGLSVALGLLLLGVLFNRLASPGAKVKSTGGDEIEYIVQNGDTVEALARLFGVDGEAIRRANGLASGDELTPGQAVRIP